MELAVQHGLRREPALKNSLGPGTFIYLVYFRVVRDLRGFNLGLDRLNDNTARIIQIFTGTRTHKLVYEPLTDNKRLRDQYHDEDDAFNDIEAGIMPRAKKKCWVALAEGVIEMSELDCAEKFFNTKLDLPAVQIYWKREFWHVPVFRKTEPCPEGYQVVDEPVTRDVFDNCTEKLGTDAGLPGKLQSYNTRRGQLQFTDTHYRTSIRNQTARHKPNSTVYETFYQNIGMNAVPQDAFMERGTSSPYPSILNYLGLFCDENAPTQVPDEDRLASKYGRASRATGPDKDEYTALQRRLATARQNYRDNVLTILRKDHFQVRNNRELQNLPERRRLAEIMGDLNEDLSREQVVRRALPEAVPSARPLLPRTLNAPPPSYTESMANSKAPTHAHQRGLRLRPERGAEATRSVSMVWQDLF
ncbi:hypothetical protein MKZ38_003105 [Zalerion maritima]|uniref:Uncharacterized protein n=1 Tax=Zalerion maritima TaxID=339359 RepID=A0AAD5RWS7_9PEZI|nr:hypothetical protein MKZ38_003105 [Zalerion maritima]